jgi:hypothetical protein
MINFKGYDFGINKDDIEQITLDYPNEEIIINLMDIEIIIKCDDLDEMLNHYGKILKFGSVQFNLNVINPQNNDEED